MATPNLRFKEFDEDWFASRIDEIASVTSGGTPSRANSQYWEGDIPWVTTSLVDFNVIHSAEEFITEEGVNNSSAKLFPKDTILMAMYGQGITRGKVAILGIEATTNQACCAIKLKNSFDIRFVFQNLMNRYDEIRDLSNDGGQKNLSSGIIKDIIVTYPSKQEQTKIASFLSNVDEKISQLTQKHELLSQYKQGMMQKLFSQEIRFKADDGSEFGEWKGKLLSEIGSFKNGLNKDKESFGLGFPFINLMDVFGKKVVDTERLGLVDANQKDLENYDLQKGDVLFIRSSVKAEGVGQTALVTDDLPNTVYSGFLIRFRDSYGLDLGFKKYCFMNNDFRLRLLAKSTTSANTNINQESLSALTINIPCLEEQAKIANFLSAIDQKIEVVAHQIEQAKTWKKGLLQQMFV